MEQDPLAPLARIDDVAEVPPPPSGAIPEDEPDQTDSAADFIPTTTMGVNLETYFLQDIRDPITRIQRLENVVMAMHEDLQNLTKISPLRKGDIPVVAEEAPVPLIEETAIVPEAPVSPAAETPEAVPAPPASVPAGEPAPRKSGTPAVSGPARINNVRVGEHPDKIRIVFDVTTTTPYRADLDNGEHLLLIEFPEAESAMPDSSKMFGKMPLLQSYKVQSFNGGKGTMVVLPLTQDTSIVYQSEFTADTGAGAHVVVDLSR